MKKEMQKKVLPTSDLLFKKVFASPQNSHILIGFINDVLELGVTEVTIEDTYDIRMFYDENKEPRFRYTQVDVQARLTSGAIVTIEMQLCKKKLFKERALYYTTNVYGSNYGMHSLEIKDCGYGRDEIKYSALRPVYCVCVMADNELTDNDDPISIFQMYDRKHERAYRGIDGTELLTMVFLELRKYNEGMQKNIRDWFDYFRQGEVEENAPEYIKDACKMANYQKLSEEERQVISREELYREDMKAREWYVWEEGKTAGLEEGREEERANIIKSMISRGKTIEEISEFTGLSEDEIKNII